MCSVDDVESVVGITSAVGSNIRVTTVVVVVYQVASLLFTFRTMQAITAVATRHVLKDRERRCWFAEEDPSCGATYVNECLQGPNQKCLGYVNILALRSVLSSTFTWNLPSSWLRCRSHSVTGY